MTFSEQCQRQTILISCRKKISAFRLRGSGELQLVPRSRSRSRKIPPCAMESFRDVLRSGTCTFVVQPSGCVVPADFSPLPVPGPSPECGQSFQLRSRSRSRKIPPCAMESFRDVLRSKTCTFVVQPYMLFAFPQFPAARMGLR